MNPQDHKSDNLQPATGSESPSPSEELSIVDLAYLLIPWRKKILGLTFLIMLVTAALTFLMDKWYESRAVIMLPEKTSTALESLGGTLGSLGQGLLGGMTASGPQRYIAILKSRRIKEEVIAKYDLIRVFDMDSTRKDTLALIELMDDMVLSENNTKNGTITVTVRFKDSPEITAEMTNFVVAKLDEINRELSTEQARSARRFIERRYTEAREELKKAEDQLNQFQNKHGIVALPEQTKASIEAAAEIQAQIVTSEAEYNVLKKTIGENHPELLKLRSKVEELSKIQRKMDSGGIEMSVLIPFKETPDLALQYLRLYREVQINQKIVEYLIPQYEQAKIQEAKDTPTLLVLDQGKPAAFQYKPKKKIIVAVAGIMAFCILCVVIAGLESLKKHPYKKSQKILAILDAVKPRNLFR